jgi:glycosyltransferase involved in cell wall biosynthesis
LTPRNKNMTGERVRRHIAEGVTCPPQQTWAAPRARAQISANMWHMKEICVFTPTYNRAYRLPALFESLCAQASDHFCWLVVDDGSTDNTRQLVEQFAQRAPFPVTYIWQENGGKQRAHNTGVEACQSPLFFCVDSDDILPPGTIDAIHARWAQVSSNPRVGGLIGLCGHNATTPLSSGMPPDLPFCTMWDLYYKHGHKGDTALIHRTELLRAHPFVVAPGEKFIAETYVYHQIDQEATLAVLDRVLIIREYLPDGYTSNVRRVTRANPKGYMRLKRQHFEYSTTFALRLKNMILYQVGCQLDSEPHRLADAPSVPYALLAWLPAKLLVKTVYREK